jgi:hypothetical protein
MSGLFSWDTFVDRFVALSGCRLKDAKLKAVCWYLRAHRGCSTRQIVTILQRSGHLPAGNDPETLDKHRDTVDAWFSRTRDLANRAAGAAARDSGLDVDDLPRLAVSS